MGRTLTPAGDIIEAARGRRGLSQNKAAELARISGTRWRQIVYGVGPASGKNAPAPTLARMAYAVGVDHEALAAAGRPDAAAQLRELRDAAPLSAPSPQIATRLGAEANRRRIEMRLGWDQIYEEGGLSESALNEAFGGASDPDDKVLEALDHALRWEPGSARSVHEGGHPRVLPLPGRTPDSNRPAPPRRPPPAIPEGDRPDELRWDPDPITGHRVWRMLRIVDGNPTMVWVPDEEDRGPEWAMRNIRKSFGKSSESDSE